LAATLLRIVAEDYMELAEKEAAKQQEQEVRADTTREAGEVFGY
jgi:hypothetical protein